MMLRNPTLSRRRGLGNGSALSLAACPLTAGFSSMVSVPGDASAPQGSQSEVATAAGVAKVMSWIPSAAKPKVLYDQNAPYKPYIVLANGYPLDPLLLLQIAYVQAANCSDYAQPLAPAVDAINTAMSYLCADPGFLPYYDAYYLNDKLGGSASTGLSNSGQLAPGGPCTGSNYDTPLSNPPVAPGGSGGANPDVVSNLFSAGARAPASMTTTAATVPTATAVTALPAATAATTTSGMSTTTWLLLGGAALLAGYFLLGKKKAQYGS
jgi:hypothetical protein